MEPLVTCAMPTADYGQYIGMAITCFLRQTYQNRELVIFDDGYKSVRHLIPDDPRIRYTYQDPKDGKWSTGRKRNWCNEQAKGSIVINWDSDDWYADNRIEWQVDRLLSSGKQMTGFHTLIFYALATPGDDKYFHWTAQYVPFATGSTQAYFRQWVIDHPYSNTHIGEDSDLSHRTHAEHQLDSTEGGKLMVIRHHPDSTSPAALASEHFPRTTRDKYPEEFLKLVEECK